MFLKNYYKFIGLSLIANPTKNMMAVNTDGVSNKTMRSDTYNTSDLAYAMSGKYLSTVASFTSSYGIKQNGIHLGTGTTPPTMDDYNLSGERISASNITAIATAKTNAEDTGCSNEISITITNNSSEDITIGEIGYVVYNNSNYYLVERTVLDEPVTIPVDGIGKVTYTISLEYPTA